MNNTYFLFQGTVALTRIVMPDIITPNGPSVLENWLLDKGYYGSDFHKRRVIPVRLKNIETGGIERLIEVSLTDDPNKKGCGEKECPDSSTVDDFLKITHPKNEPVSGPIEDVLIRISPSGEKLVTYIDFLNKLVITDVKTSKTVLEHTLTVPHQHFTHMPDGKKDFLFFGNYLYFLTEMGQVTVDCSNKPLNNKDIEHQLRAYKVDLDTGSISSNLLYQSKGIPFNQRLTSVDNSIESPLIISNDGKYMVAGCIHKDDYKAFIHFIDLDSLTFDKGRMIYLPSRNEKFSSKLEMLTSVLNEDSGEIYLIAVRDNSRSQRSKPSKYSIYTLDTRSHSLSDLTEFEGPSTFGSYATWFHHSGNIIGLFGLNIEDPLDDQPPQLKPYVEVGLTHHLIDPVDGLVMIYNLNTHKPTFSEFPKGKYMELLQKLDLPLIQNLFLGSSYGNLGLKPLNS